VLLPGVVAMVIAVVANPVMSGRARFVLPSLIAVNLACLAQNFLQTGSFWFLWVAPALLALYAAAKAPRAVPAAELVPTQSPTAA
jgi:hypothetical protein